MSVIGILINSTARATQELVVFEVTVQFLIMRNEHSNMRYPGDRQDVLVVRFAVTALDQGLLFGINLSVRNDTDAPQSVKLADDTDHGAYSVVLLAQYFYTIHK